MMMLDSRSRKILLLVAVALVSAGVTVYLTGDRLDTLSSGTLERARKDWAVAGLRNYDLAIEVEGSGLTRGVHEVAVRDGHAIRATREGVVSSGDPGSYAVEGLLGILDRELELAADPSKAYGAPAGYRAYLQVKFDDRGIPHRFRRVVGGNNAWVDWRILGLKETTLPLGLPGDGTPPASAP